MKFVFIASVFRVKLLKMLSVLLRWLAFEIIEAISKSGMTCLVSGSV